MLLANGGKSRKFASLFFYRNPVANAKIIECHNCRATLALYIPTERMTRLRAQLRGGRDIFHRIAEDGGFRAWFRSLDAFAIGTGKIHSLERASHTHRYIFVDCSEGNVFKCPACKAGLSLRECLEQQILNDRCGILLDDGTTYRAIHEKLDAQERAPIPAEQPAR